MISSNKEISMALEFMLADTYTTDMKIPKKLTDNPPPVGWYMSEKLDGYRAQYNPESKMFISRQNKPFNAPKWFVDQMPNEYFDGELYCGRGNFQNMGVVRKKIPVDEEWQQIRYRIYDAPKHSGTFEERYKYILSFDFQSSPNINILTHCKVEDIASMKQFYEKIIAYKGEGIMLNNPDAKYEGKRTPHLLKYKPSYDAEAIIIGYKEGTNKYEGMLGSFICQPIVDNDGQKYKDENLEHVFNISGMNDEIRKNYRQTHPFDTIITYEYSDITNKGKPRFARYLRIREDIEISEPIVEDIPMKKTAITDNIRMILMKIGESEKMSGQVFKSKAYYRASESLKGIDDSELIPEELLKLPGIGKSIMEKIIQIKNTGTCPAFEKIKDQRDPREIFMGIHGVGTVQAGKLVKQGFKSIQELRECETIDEVLNDVQKKGLKYYENLQEKIPYDEISQNETFLKQVLHSIDSTAELTIAGSYRRNKVKSGDMDVLIKTPSVRNNSIYKQFIEALIEYEYIADTLSYGNKKFMGVSKQYLGKFVDNGGIHRRIDIMFTKPYEYPFAILYFTGSKEFNVKMRAVLLKNGLTLNEYSLKHTETKKMVDHVFKDEMDIFKYIGCEYVEPHNR